MDPPSSRFFYRERLEKEKKQNSPPTDVTHLLDERHAGQLDPWGDAPLPVHGVLDVEEAAPEHGHDAGEGGVKGLGGGWI